VRNSVDSKDFHGKTDGAGLVQQKVPPSAKEGELTLWPDPDDKRTVLTWKLKLGHLDPADSITGVQARLINLGYFSGPADGQLSNASKAALAAFQSDNGITPATGEMDAATTAKLADVHDVGAPSH
jgi:peptidoglycan hydrolase-like protein with peptidoglycan-binding domain